MAMTRLVFHSRTRVGVRVRVRVCVSTYLFYPHPHPRRRRRRLTRRVVLRPSSSCFGAVEGQTTLDIALGNRLKSKINRSISSID